MKTFKIWNISNICCFNIFFRIFQKLGLEKIFLYLINSCRNEKKIIKKLLCVASTFVNNLISFKPITNNLGYIVFYVYLIIYILITILTLFDILIKIFFIPK